MHLRSFIRIVNGNDEQIEWNKEHGILGVIEGSFGWSFPDLRVLGYESCASSRMNLFDELLHGNSLETEVPVETVVVAKPWTSWGRRLNWRWCLIGSHPDITIRNLDIPDIRDTIFHFVLIDYRTSWATDCSSIGILMNRMIFRRGRERSTHSGGNLQTWEFRASSVNNSSDVSVTQLENWPRKVHPHPCLSWI